MKGLFKDQAAVKSFISPMKDFAALMGDSGIVINFGTKTSDNKVPVSITALNQAAGVVILASFKDLFDDFTFDSDSGCKIGVVKVSEFVNLFSLFSDAELAVDFDETTKSLSLSQGKSKVTYQTADPDLIKQFTKSFNSTKWIASFVLDESFKKFNRAMSVLGNEECILIEGNTETAKVSLTIKNKTVSINSYTLEVDAQITENFNIFFRKDAIQKVFNSGFDSMKMSIGERICDIECSNQHCVANYYLAKML
jgi:hypothetical protein